MCVVFVCVDGYYGFLLVFFFFYYRGAATPGEGTDGPRDRAPLGLPHRATATHAPLLRPSDGTAPIHITAAFPNSTSVMLSRDYPSFTLPLSLQYVTVVVAEYTEGGRGPSLLVTHRAALRSVCFGVVRFGDIVGSTAGSAAASRELC